MNDPNRVTQQMTCPTRFRQKTADGFFGTDDVIQRGASNDVVVIVANFSQRHASDARKEGGFRLRAC